MAQQDILGATIDSLRASVAVLDHDGSIVAVNESWRRFGSQRDASSDCVGQNYLHVCFEAANSGDASAVRVAMGLSRLLRGEAQTFGHVYRGGDRFYRLTAQHVGSPSGGVIVAHEDISALIRAKQERDRARGTVEEVKQEHVAVVSHAHEEVAQRLAAISLAVHALEEGGDVANATALIRMALIEAHHQLRTLRN
ncbi:MAG: PAS domain-containing protein [Sphingomicrobium sp.]